MVKDHGIGIKGTQVGISPLSMTSCMSLGKSVSFFEPQDS